MVMQALRVNPQVAARVCLERGKVVGLQARCFARRRSWSPITLAANQTSLANRIIRLLEAGPEADIGELSGQEQRSLLQTGLLILGEPADGRPELSWEEDAAPWLPPQTPGARLVARLYPEMISILDGRIETYRAETDHVPSRVSFATERFVALPELLTAADTSLVSQYYRRLIESGLLKRADAPDRWIINNDPIGRALLRLFKPIVQTIVGRRIRESYTFAAEYFPGAVLPMHLDRAHCEYTISLFLDYSPLSSNERSPWPLNIESSLHAQLRSFHQARGEGVLFKGRELRHGRPALPQSDRCLVLMLHYVDADFPDEQMDRS